MKQATANVHVEDQFSVPPKCRGSNWGFLVTSDGVVMLDTPMVPRTAVERRSEIARRGEVRYIINTHHHVDHVTGNFFFPGPVVSHQSVREAFLAPLASVSGSERVDEAVKIGQGTIGYIRLLVGEHDPESLPLLDSEKYQIKMPSITFSEKLRLYVGDHTIELIHLPGHTEGHIGVYLPEERVFLRGITSATGPSLRSPTACPWNGSRR